MALVLGSWRAAIGRSKRRSHDPDARSVCLLRPEVGYCFRVIRATWAPVAASHSRAMPSAEAVTTHPLSGEKAPHDLWAIVLMHYREVVQSRKPLFAPVSVSNERWYTKVSRLLLPLSTDGVTIDRVMAADDQRVFT